MSEAKIVHLRPSTPPAGPELEIVRIDDARLGELLDDSSQETVVLPRIPPIAPPSDAEVVPFRPSAGRQRE
jgi:hypothetical protein